MPKTPEDWHRHFMRLARLKAEDLATCLRRKVGAVIVRGKHDIATGYNGAASGVDECVELGRCMIIAGHCAGCAHAELNAIVNAAKDGTRVEGTTLYSLVEPCLNCTLYIINAGIARVIWEEPYFAAGHGNRDERVLTYKNIRQSGIQWQRLLEDGSLQDVDVSKEQP